MLTAMVKTVGDFRYAFADRVERIIKHSDLDAEKCARLVWQHADEGRSIAKLDPEYNHIYPRVYDTPYVLVYNIPTRTVMIYCQDTLVESEIFVAIQHALKLQGVIDGKGDC